MASHPVPCVIIGTDGYAFELLKRIYQVPKHLRMVAACTLNPEGDGAMFCRQQGTELVREIPQLFGLVPPRCSVVFNPTPIPLHFETTLRCLEAGFHVALEKPPVPTVQELDQLVNEGARRRRQISVGFNYLYSNICRNLREKLIAGQIGKLRRIKAVAAWSRPMDYYAGSCSRGRIELDGRPLFDGALGNPLSHVLAFMLSLASTGQEEMASPLSVQAELYRSRDYVTADDIASVRVIVDSGVELILNLTVAAARKIDPVIEIEGDNGSARVIHFEHYEISSLGGSTRAVGQTEDPRLMMLKDIATAIGEEKAPLITLAKCRPFTQTINAAYESAINVVPVPMEFRRSVSIDGRTFHCVDGIESALMEAHAQTRLLSEAGCQWARPSPVFSSVNYKRFSMCSSEGGESAAPGARVSA